MTLPDWTPEQTQQLAQGLARVEIDYRRVPCRVRVVPMMDEAKRRRHVQEHVGRVVKSGSITPAEYRRRMGWPPV